MAYSIKQKLDQIKSDFKYIRSTYGDVIDFTGSGMEEGQLEMMLDTPTKTTAFNCYRERLDEIFRCGYEITDRTSRPLPFFDDEKLQEIGDRWLLSVPEISQ